MKTKAIYYLSILLFLFISCNQKQDDELAIDGIWNSVGYGYQLVITEDTTTMFDINENGCSLNQEFPNELLGYYYEVSHPTDDSLSLTLGFTRYDFIRVAPTAQFCQEILLENTPYTNFDALWQTFDENYISFELRGVDWNQLREKYRPRLNEESTDLELFNVLKEMTDELEDEHVSIEIPESLEDEIEEEEDFDHLRDLVIATINKYHVKNAKSYNKGVVNWGDVDNNLGFIQINDFENLADYGIDPTLSPEEFWDNYEKRAVESENYASDVISSFENQMAIIFQDIKSTSSCIIDVRFNGGGLDQIGLEVLSYFINEEKEVFSKKARFENGFTDTQTITIKPNANIYGGKLFLLTSSQTASAAETFVLASLNLTQAKRIGSKTEGILSDVLSKRLPNGWEYGLSNEIYESIDDFNYEKIGIPPDFIISYSTESEVLYMQLLNDLETEDDAIEKAKELAFQ